MSRTTSAANDSFRDTPPAGVAIWDRLLAYGTALGVAYATAAALPIGPTCDDAGWSPQRGLWREVRIEYPRRFAYGDAPKRAVAVSLFVLVAASAALVVVARGVLPAVLDGVDELTKKENGPGRWLFAVVVVVFSVPLAYLTVQVVRRIVILWRAIPDLRETRTFDGYVVRVPWHYESDGNGNGQWEPTGYVAVDDGSSDEVRAVRCADRRHQGGAARARDPDAAAAPRHAHGGRRPFELSAATSLRVRWRRRLRGGGGRRTSAGPARAPGSPTVRAATWRGRTH